jgi:hypothetical protein
MLEFMGIVKINRVYQDTPCVPKYKIKLVKENVSIWFKLEF